MKLSTLSALALAVGASGFVLPSQEVFAELEPSGKQTATHDETFESAWNNALEGFKSGATQAFEDVLDVTNTAKDYVVDTVRLEDHDPAGMLYHHCNDDELDETSEEDSHRPHHGRPHHPRHYDLTLYQLISKSKYTTKLAALVDKFDEVKEALNSTAANHTLFAPTDKAFEKIPEHGKHPSKEFLLKLLGYHVVQQTYSAKDILGVHTLPTSLGGNNLSSDGSKTLQRLSVGFGWRGVTVNKYSRVVYPNVFGTNGVVHAVDSILVPPPSIGTLVSLLPAYFSTLELAFHKTGLDKIADMPHLGATVFAPPNNAWARLGPKVNGFLFSKYGRKYLKALLKYHIVANQTLYSDHYYGSEAALNEEAIPKGRYHVDLPTLLHGETVSVDIGRFGGLIDMHVNHYSRVSAQDIIADDGVMHAINNVLVPPKKHGNDDEEEKSVEDMTVEELKERLSPLVDEDGDDKEADEAMQDWETMSYEL